MDPKGVRNNNPGNVRAGDKWQGMVGEDADGFAVFERPEDGLRAMSKVLDTYANTHGINTIEGVVGRWAPPSENDTAAYVAAVSSALGVGGADTIDINDASTRSKLMSAIIQHENGQNPYTPEQLSQGIEASGMTFQDITTPGQNIMPTNAGQGGMNPNDPATWQKDANNLLLPDTPDIGRDPLAGGRDYVQEIRGDQNSVNLLGGATGQDTLEGMSAAQDTPWYMKPVMGFRTSNAGNDLWNFVERSASFPRDTQFSDNLPEKFKEFQKQVPPQYHAAFAHIGSDAEMKSVIGEINRDLNDMRVLQYSGLTGVSSQLLAGTFDVDMALALVPGYSEAKVGVVGARLARIGKGVRQGFKAGAAIGVIQDQLNPTASNFDLPMNILGSTVFGGVGGAIGKLREGVDYGIDKTLGDMHDARLRGQNPAADPPDVDDGAFQWPSWADVTDKLGFGLNPEKANRVWAGVQHWVKEGPVHADAFMQWAKKHIPEDAIAQVRKVVDDLRANVGKKKVGDVPETDKSMGAAQTFNRQPLEDIEGIADETLDAIKIARRWRDDTDWHRRAQDQGHNPTVARMLEIVNKIPGMRTAWEVMAYSKSALANKLSYDLLSDPIGRVVNPRAAAYLKDLYQRRIMSLYNPVEDVYQRWAQSRGAGWLDRNWHSNERQTFDRDLRLEMLRREGQGSNAPDPSVNPWITEAADHWGKAMDEAHAIAVGRNGERSVHGFDPTTRREGYVPVIWKGHPIRMLINRLGDRMKVIDEWADMIRADHPNMTPAEAKATATAFLNRALSKDSEVDSSLLNMLSGDGREYLRQELKAQKLADDVVDRILDKLGGKVEERGMSARAKGRLTMDLRRAFSDGTMLLDLVDNDMRGLIQHYAHGISGQSALARKGLRSAADVKDLINKVLTEQEALGVREGADTHVSREYLEHVFSYFGTGPVNRGVNQTFRLMKQITNLALLNQLALAQLAETGTTIAAVGWSQWLKTAGPMIREVFNTPTHARSRRLFHELEQVGGKIGDAHNIYRDDILLEEVRRDPSAATSWMDVAEKAVLKGRRIQGFTSLFNQVQSIQHKISMEIMIGKVIKELRDLGPNTERLASLGIQGRTLKRIKKYVDNGTVQFAPDGTVSMLNVHQWDAHAAEEFTVAMNIATYRHVQRAMAGEETKWMTSDVGSLFMHLKSFPFLAMKKQFIREARINDAETKALFMYAMATAGIAYAAKQALNGNFENLDPGSIAVGAFGMSNVTGWVPMWTDPVASMFGLDEARFNQYGARGVSTGVLPVPAAIPTLNKMAHLPAAAIHALPFGGDFTDSDIAALKTVPIVGSAYGFSTMLNMMKD